MKKTAPPATQLGDHLSIAALMVNKTPATPIGDYLNTVAYMNGQQTCIWARHCFLGSICPGGKCVIADCFEQDIQRNLLICPLVRNTRDKFCNLAPLRRHTISLCNCTDGSTCLFIALPSVDNLFSRESPFLFYLSDAIANGALTTSRALDVLLSQYPEVLQKIIGEIEEKLVS